MAVMETNRKGARIKVLIADSHPVFRQGLEACLAETPDIRASGKVGEKTEIPQCLESDEHDVMLLDTHMTGTDGYALLKQIKEGYPRLPVLLMSATWDVGWLIRGIRAGAAGVVLKNAPSGDFEEAIRRVHAGQPYIAEPLSEKLVLYFQRHESKPLDERLSPREFEVMRLLSQGLKLAQIARKLELTHQTIATHRRHIMEKTGLRNNAEIIRYGIMNGLDGTGETLSPQPHPWGRLGEG